MSSHMASYTSSSLMERIAAANAGIASIEAGIASLKAKEAPHLANISSQSPKGSSHGLSPSLFDQIITIEVGPEKTKFHVHKGLLVYYSAYFRGALEGNFKEAKEHTIYMDDEDANLFRLVKAWMYTQHIADTLGEEIEYIFELFALYIFGEKRMIPKLRHYAISTIIEGLKMLKKMPNNDQLITYVYENTSESNPLRKLLVDLNVYRLDHTTWEPPAALPTEFLLDVIKEMRRATEFPRGWSFLEPSKYFMDE